MQLAQGLSRCTAVVTGATHGVGRAIVARLLAAGFIVFAVGRDEALLAELAASQPLGLLLPLVLDLASSDPGVVERAGAAVTGSVDALVHVAGAIETGALLGAATGPALLRQMQTNAVGPLRLTAALRPRLATGSRIVFVNSSQALGAGPGTGGYAASKHALRAIADSLRSELAEDAIGVTSIYLGRTATRMQEHLYAERHEDYHPELLIQPETVAEVVARILTLPEDVEVTDVRLRPSVKSY